MNITDLDFKPHDAHMGGVRAKAFFPNGFGVSVIQTPYSYGGDEGLYEIGVLKGTADSHVLTYETPITDDVLGHLSVDEVNVTLAAVEALAPATEAAS